MDKKIKNILRKFGFGENIDKVEHSFCPTCSKPVVNEDFKDELSWKEYQFSGLCMDCQGKVFK